MKRLRFPLTQVAADIADLSNFQKEGCKLLIEIPMTYFLLEDSAVQAQMAFGLIQILYLREIKGLTLSRQPSSLQNASNRVFLSSMISDLQRLF